MKLFKFITLSVIILLITRETTLNQFHSAALIYRLDRFQLSIYVFFRNVTETEILESIMCLNKEGGIKDISRELFVMCKYHVAYHLNELLNFCITPGVHPNIFKNCSKDTYL